MKSVLSPVSGNRSEWGLLPLCPLSGSHSNGHLQKHTGTHRDSPSSHTDRTTPRPAPGHRPPLRRSAADQTRYQSIQGSIDSDVCRGGSAPARGLRRDPRRRSSEWWHQRVRVPILPAWADRSFIRLDDLLTAAPIGARLHHWSVD